MTKHELETDLRRSLHNAPLRPARLGEILSLVKAEIKQHPVPKRLSFWGFLGSQVRFIGWKIWFFQALTLLVLSALSFSLWNTSLISPRLAALLLSGCSILSVMTALPFLHRSRRYQMCEVELAARFSGVKQLGAKLLILSIGDLAMLSSIFCFAVAKTDLPVSSVFYCLLLPYLTATSGLLYLIGHTPGTKWMQNSVLVCGILFLGLFLLTKASPMFQPDSASPIWVMACLVLAACCVYQTHSIFSQSPYDEIQLL